MANLKRLTVPLAFIALAGCSSVDGINLAEDERGAETVPGDDVGRSDGDDVGDNDSEGVGATESDGDPSEGDDMTSDLAFVEGAVGAEAVDSSIVAAADGSPLHDVDVALVGIADVSPPSDTAPSDQAEFLVVSGGDGGQVVAADGVAGVAYTMVAWEDGAIVEESSTFASPLLTVIGNPADRPPSAVRLPRAVEQSLIGQPVGTRMLISLPAGLSDLPAYLDSEVAHLLVVDIESFQAPAGAAS